MPSLSPKGDRMFYNRYGKGVWLQTISEPPGEPILVDRRGWGTAWSPDGTRVAYASYNPVNLVVYDVEQQTRSSLFDDATNPYRQILWNFVWSPDSKQIAFKGVKAADGKSVLAIVDARGDRFHHSVIFEGDLLPTVTWNPDGKQILFASHCEETNNPRQIYSINPLMADQPKLLPQQARNRWLQDMSFSPDGTKLAIMAHRPFKK